MTTVSKKSKVESLIEVTQEGGEATLSARVKNHKDRARDAKIKTR
jgi:hypothetical protein